MNKIDLMHFTQTNGEEIRKWMRRASLKHRHTGIHIAQYKIQQARNDSNSQHLLTNVDKRQYFSLRQFCK